MKPFTATLQLKFLDYWHAGGSHGQGFHTQATVARDQSGLPYLPGRTLKGLLRDAVSQLTFVKRLPTTISENESASDPEHVCQTLFGKAGAHPGYIQSGCVSVGSARLSEAVRMRLTPDQASAEHKDSLKEQLFHVLYSTCIDEEKGVAQAHSLRAIEVAVPMTLHAELTSLPPIHEPPELLEHWPEIIRASLVFLTAAGSLRHRGLGRLQASLHCPERF